MKKVYFPNLNGVRFFAALSVIIYHYYGIEVLNGHLGVILFFVLSGFLITYLLFEEKITNNSISISKFYIRRILRIWPLYFLILLISTINYFYFENKNIEEYFSIIPFYLFFIPNVAFVLDKILKFSGILWSVGSEEQFYFLWPWIIKRFSNKTIIITFVFITLFFMISPHVIDFINNNFLGNEMTLIYITKLLNRMSFGSMATGGILAYISIFKKKYLTYLINNTIQWLAFVILILCWNLNIEFLFNDQFYATLFGILIINFSINPKPIFSLENRVFNYLGKISYGLYVYHLIAFSISSFIFSIFKFKGIPNIIIFISGLFLSILISGVSYKYLEQPFLKIKTNKYTIIKTN